MALVGRFLFGSWASGWCFLPDSDFESPWTQSLFEVIDLVSYNMRSACSAKPKSEGFLCKTKHFFVGEVGQNALRVAWGRLLSLAGCAQSSRVLTHRLVCGPGGVILGTMLE